MQIAKGTVVISKSGHDKGDFQVIMSFDKNYAYVCDGKFRPLEKPKKKKFIHLKVTNTILDEKNLRTNKLIRSSLKLFNR